MEVPVPTSYQKTRRQRHRFCSGGCTSLASYRACLPQLRCFWDLCSYWLPSRLSCSFWKPFWQYCTRVQEVSLRYVWDCLVLTGRADVVNIARHSNGNLRCECPRRVGHLSVRRNSQHAIRTTQNPVQLHLFADHQTMGSLDDRLLPRYCPFRVHLYAIRPRGSRVASPPTLCV